MLKVGRKLLYVAFFIFLFHIVNKHTIQDEKLPVRRNYAEQFVEPIKISESSTTQRPGTSKKIFPATQMKVSKPIKPIQSKLIKKFHQRLNLTKPGHLGRPVVLPKSLPHDMKFLFDQGYSRYKINEFISNLVPLDRELPDVRTEYCKRKIYPKKLPKASIITIFYNEPLTMILRTIYSIINRTPPHLLGEIILVDDCSTHDNLRSTLANEVAKLDVVKLIRLSPRVGLIKARMFGAMNAKEQALIFMDSHIEVTQGWIEPLLARLAINRNITAISVMDTIDMDTLEFRYTRDPNSIPITGFDWNMIFKWMPVPDFERRRRKNPNEPIRSPTMLGAFFVIDRQYFYELGMYDPEFEIWGAENLELAFKVWMCHGEVEVVPCSHAGHLFRKKFPYSFPDKPGQPIIRRNTDRLAAVWLDDYIKYYHRKMGRRNDFGDIRAQKEIRERLSCKSFDWYIKNVYPNVQIPEELTDEYFVKRHKL